MEAWLPKASAAGITSVFDAGVPPIGDDQGALIELYAATESRGALPFRVVASYSVKSPPVDDAAAKLTDIRDRISTELVQVGAVKIIGDGTQGGYTAWLIDPYADKPDSAGASPFTEDQWHQLIGGVDAAGFDVHVHACGERTARVALDSIERAIAANPPGTADTLSRIWSMFRTPTTSGSASSESSPSSPRTGCPLTRTPW